MSANFYDTSGVMIGVDVHGYKPGPPAWFHLSTASFFGPVALITKRTPRVTSEGHAMLQQGYDIYYVPHVPVPFSVPAPGFPMKLAKIIALSGTKAALAVRSVTAQGGKLACCVTGFTGLNVNCNDPADGPTGYVLQFNTVQTQPTKGDIAGAAVGTAIDSAIGWAAGKALEAADAGFIAEAIVKHIVRRMPEILGDWADMPGTVADWVQDWFDGKQKEGS